MPEYTLYVDVLLLRLGCNFIFEYLLLWSTATVTKTRTKPIRLALGSAVGTFHYFLYLLASLGLIPYYGFLRFFPVVVLVSIAMMLMTFPSGWSQLKKVAPYFYGIGFVAAGTGMAGAYLIGGPGTPQFFIGMLVSIVTILVVAELGWGIVHDRMTKRMYQISLGILCEGVSVELKALVDTGNSLKDPLNRQPVIIVEKEAITNLLPPELEPIILALDQGELTATDRLVELEKWQTRIRLIPFSSIGRKNGLLLGFRPDEIQIGGKTLCSDLHPTIAIHPHFLDPQGEFKALVPPQLVEDIVQSTNLGVRKGGESHAKAISKH